MAVAQGPFLAAALLLVSSGLHCSSPPPACPESCNCQSAPLLNCSSSGLSLVPHHVQDAVTVLDLSHNLLDSVALKRPHPNLRSVWLGNNTLTHLSLCIEANLGSQTIRGIHPHRMRPWSRCVSWAPTLQLLSAERNLLVQLPEGLEGSVSLQVLQLSFNRISNLRPGALGRLRQLRELHLQHNLITSLHPQMFQDLAQLRVLDLSFNMLTSLHPLIYLSLHNIGADVRLDGNRWQCDCRMRSLRRRLAYDSSRGLQVWSVVCTFPSAISGKDLLQLEEDDLNCFGTENMPELHRDVTVYSGSEILLSCSTQDSMWWTPSGQASVSQPQAGLLISDATKRDKGLYVCMSEEHEVVSVFNLQISRIGHARRQSRSLPITSRQVIPQGTPIRTGQEQNQRATESDLTLAVCLSVFITFLIAFILGVLARPCIDALWTKVIKRKDPSATNSVSSVEQGQYENEAYSSEEPEAIVTHRERRVTFSTIDVTGDSNVQYYATIASGNQESINNGAVIECDAAKSEEDKHATGDSGSGDSSQQSNPEVNQRDSRDLSGVTDENIPYPNELGKRRSLSSCSDSSLSDKAAKENHMIKEDNATPNSPQLAKDSVQERADSSASGKVDVPQISIGDRSEIPGFSSEPFRDWSPHEEQFEFSDSVRSISARSSSVFGSFDDSQMMGVPTSDKQNRDNTSSSSSYVSEDEPTQYTVNSDQEEEEDTERNHKKSEVTNTHLKLDASFEQQIHGVDPIEPSGEFNQVHYRHDTHSSSSSSENESEIPNLKVKHKKGRVSQINKCLDISSPASDSSSSDETTDPTTKLTTKQVRGEVDKAGLPTEEYQSVSCGDGRDATKPQWPDLDLGHITPIKSRVDIRAPSPPMDSSSSDESADQVRDQMQKQKKGEKVDISKLPLQKSETAGHDPEPVLIPEYSSFSSDSEDEKADHTVKQRPMKVDTAELQKSQTLSHEPDTRWPALDLDHIPSIKRRLDIRAPSPPMDSSSSDESADQVRDHMQKQKKGEKVDISKLPLQKSQTAGHDPEPVLIPEYSSSSSDSEDEKADHTVKQRPMKVDTAELQKSQTLSHDPDTRWPALDLDHIPSIKRRLDIRAPSPPMDSSSSDESADQVRDHMQKQKKGEKVDISKLPLQKSQTAGHDPEPVLIPEYSSSSSDSEDEKADHTVKQRPMKVDTAELQKSQTLSHDPDTRWPALDLDHIPSIKRRLDIRAPSPYLDSSSTSDSEDEKADHTVKQRPAQVDIAELQKSNTVSEDQDARWPALDLDHIPSIKRRLDIRAPSPPMDSSSSDESVDQVRDNMQKQKKGEKVDISKLPLQKSQTAGHDPEPVLIPEYSSSSSDSEDEKADHTVKQRPMKVDTAELQKSQTLSHDPDTRWPALDLDHIPSIKRRLDIRVPSPSPDSSSSSDSEDETTNHIKKQEQGSTHMANSPVKVSQTVSHDPETRWPAVDLEHIPHIKRRLDIKPPAPDSDSFLSIDSEDETMHHTKTRKLDAVELAGLSYQETQKVSHDPDTRGPAVDLDHIPSIKRRLDIRAPSPSPDSSSSSDSEDETTNHIKKQEQGAIHMANSPVKVSQTLSHDPETRWPAVDREHIPRIKRRLDIRAPSPSPGSPSSSDSEDEATNHIKKKEQGVIHVTNSPVKVSQTISHDPETKWPAVDLDHIPGIKRRLDIKPPAPDSDSSSSIDSEDQTHHKESQGRDIAQIKKQGELHTNLLLQKSPTGSRDQQTLRPSVDLDKITRIKRRLDIKTPLSPPDSISGGSKNHTVEEKTEEAKNNSPCHSSSSSGEQEEDTEDLSKLPVTVKPDPDPRWPQLGVSKAPQVQRRLDVKTHSPSAELSSNSDMSDSWTTDLLVKVERQRANVGITNDQPGTKLPYWNKTAPAVKRRLDIRAPPQPVDSYSSSSESEGEKRDNDAKVGMGVSAVSKASEKEFIRSLKTPGVNMFHSPKTNHNIKLEKYTVIEDDSQDKTNDNVSTTPELKSQWATMNLGMSRFRKHLHITSHARAPPSLPTTPPPDSPSSSSSESGSGNKSSKTRLKIKRVGMQETISRMGDESDSVWPPLSLTNAPHVKRALDIRAPVQSESSSSSKGEVIDHSVPDLSFGVPRIKRRLNIKAPSPEPDNSPSSCSGSENEVTEYTGKQNRYASYISGMTDSYAQITYKRSIIKTSLPLSNSSSARGKSHTTDHAEMVTDLSHSVGDRNAVLVPRNLPSMNFDDIVKKRVEQSRSNVDVDLPPEIRWTGIGHHLSDFSSSSPRKHLDVGSPPPQQMPPAEHRLSPPDSPNFSHNKSDNKVKQDNGKADVTQLHKYSSLSARTVSPASSRALDEFDNSSGSTNEILRAVSDNSRERKGLSALKSMSAERQKWDLGNEDLVKGASPQFDHHTTKQPRTQTRPSSSSEDERSAADLLYGIPLYRRHDAGNTEPLPRVPPPIPATTPPDEAGGLTWGSPQSSKTQVWEATRSYLQHSRNVGESDPSLTSENLALYFDSSNTNISNV